jgi:H+-translocating NAD(P) transhydrogenase subunit alpha
VSAEDAKAAETEGGYAKEMSEDYKRKQAQVLRDHLKKQDVVVTTALIPGRPAPRLIDASMVAEMKPGAVIVDLAVESGGNCELSELGKIVVKHGVTIVGHPNVPSRIAADASALYARNLWSFLSLLIDAKEKALKIDWEDEIVKGMLLVREGIVVHQALAGGGK